MALVALLAPLLAPYDPLEQDYLSNLSQPTREHLMGTDEFGRDVLSRLIYGARVSLLVAVVSVTISLVLGTLLGLTGGYLGGWWEVLAMRGSDVLLSLPPILLAMAAVAFLGSSLFNLTLIIGVLYTPRFARVVHAAAVREKNQDYVEAQRALGARTLRVLGLGILPNIIAPIMVQASLSLGFAILLEAGPELSRPRGTPTATLVGQHDSDRSRLYASGSFTCYLAIRHDCAYRSSIQYPGRRAQGQPRPAFTIGDT